MAERPIRCAGFSKSASSRSSDSARCAPRFVPATACTSSTITVSTVVRIERAAEVSIRKSDSGVVIRMSGGVRTIAARSFCEVSPVRTATRSSEPQPREGPAQVPLDVVVERLQRRDVEEPQALAGPCVEPVDAVEERGERLAGTGRRLDEDVAAARDRGPAGRLGGRRPLERTLEPLPRLR